MPDRYSLLDYIRVTNQHPACPLCQAEMMLTRTMPAHLGFDIRTFECPKCDRVEQVIVANDAFGTPGSELPHN